MKISFLPKSRLGKWSVGVNIFLLLAGTLFYILTELLNIITSDILITIIGATTIIAALTTFFTGAIAVIKLKERSVLIFLPIFIGLIILAFIIGDILGLPDI